MTGFLHSPIHLGYAIEFDQPLIAAEALALTAVHDASFGSMLAAIEETARRSSTSEHLADLRVSICASEPLRMSMDYTHGVFQIRDGFLAKAKEEFMELIGSWKVRPHELQEKTAESLNSSRMYLFQDPSLCILHVLGSPITPLGSILDGCRPTT